MKTSDPLAATGAQGPLVERASVALPPPMDPGVLLTPEALAERWSCSRAFIYKLMDKGLPSLKLGRARRIRLGDAERWLDANAEAAS